MKLFHTLPLVAAMAIAAPVLAAGPTACPQHFAAGQPPQIVNAKLRPQTRELCFEAFAVLHSGLSHTPLYSAEHLTRQNLEQARELPRRDSFHAEDRLPERERAELSDYARSGYDRGHMAPNADMPTRSAQAESFSLANMVPQLHENNAGVWAGIEAAARQLARDEGELYVVSGPAFVGQDIKQIGRGVLVPTHLWKVVYSPRQQRAGAYLIDNDTSQDWRALSLAELEHFAGINALPALPQKVREAGMKLPDPAPPQHDHKPRSKPKEDSLLQDLSRALLAFLNKLVRF
ncbi:MAG: hypothetical protein RJA36_1027 [Pseudomonadota bacterium]|jgi:endonuclease G